MTAQEFVDKVNQQYFIAHNLHEGDGGYNIIRGMAHTVSGYLEDVFALYMAQKIDNKDFQYLVDKLLSIRFSKNGRATTFKPDLTILNDNVVTHYYDLKTNLGWNRDLEKYLKQKNELIERIKGRNGWIHFSKENVQNITFSKNLKYEIVVFNGWNINPEHLSINVNFAATLENLEFHVLNNWNKAEDKMDIDLKAFDRLYKEHN
jgi:hypothetical protein